MMAIHCEGRRPAEIYSMETVFDAPQDRIREIRQESGTAYSWELVRV